MMLTEASTAAPHRTAPHRTAPRRVASHRTVPHRTVQQREGTHTHTAARAQWVWRTGPHTELAGHLPPLRKRMRILVLLEDADILVVAAGGDHVPMGVGWVLPEVRSQLTRAAGGDLHGGVHWEAVLACKRMVWTCRGGPLPRVGEGDRLHPLFVPLKRVQHVLPPTHSVPQSAYALIRV